MVKFAIVDNNYFCYKNTFYKQKKGLAMGNSISPILADLVLEQLFKESLPQLEEQPKFIKKYVDDIILAIPEKFIDSTKTIFEFFDPNIKFTVEKEEENQINFLDITLIRTGNKITTNWHKKKTSSGRTLNYYSNHPYHMKQNIVTSFIKKVLTLSDDKFKKDNINQIKEILSQNNYPKEMVNNSIYKYLHLRQNSNNTQNLNNHSQLIQNSQNIRTIFGSLSYVPKLTEKIQKILTNNNLVSKIALKPLNKCQILHSKIKDVVPIENKSDVVYEFECMCNNIYIGQTGSKVKDRIYQHKYSITSKQTNYAVVQHHKPNIHEYKFDKVKIKHIEKNKQKRELLEQCEIFLNNHRTINKITDTQNLNFNYRNLLHKYKQIKSK